MAASSKVVAVSVTYPYQVVRARLQDQEKLYSGVRDMVLRIARSASGVILIYIIINVFIFRSISIYIVHLKGPWAKNASRRIADNACRRVWTFNYMNANERRRTHTHERRRKGTDADARMQTQAPDGARTLNICACSAWVEKSSRRVLRLDERTRTFEVYYMWHTEV